MDPCGILGYAPDSGLPLEDESFWHQLHGLAGLCGEHDQLYVLLDANAAPGTCVFRSDLPSSSGTSWFWLSTDCASRVQGLSMRVHYIRGDPPMDVMNIALTMAAPRDCIGHCHLSRLIPQLDLGHGDWDHTAIGLEMSWQDVETSCPTSSVRHHCFDSRRISPHTVQAIMHDYQPAEWHVHVESQVMFDSSMNMCCRGFIDIALSQLLSPKSRSLIPSHGILDHRSYVSRRGFMLLQGGVEMSLWWSSLRRGVGYEHSILLVHNQMHQSSGTMVPTCYVTDFGFPLNFALQPEHSSIGSNLRSSGKLSLSLKAWLTTLQLRTFSMPYVLSWDLQT